MTLKGIQKIHEALNSLQDFAHANSDGDESGIYEEMIESYELALSILEKEGERLKKRNFDAMVKRYVKKGLK